jgi:hypothetical protein
MPARIGPLATALDQFTNSEPRPPMIRILLVFLVAVLIAALLRLAWLRWRGQPRRLIVSALVAAGVAVLLLAIATGRLHWLYSIPAALLAFAGRILPLLGIFRRLGGGAAGIPGAGGGPGSGPDDGEGTSRVNARFLTMELDHATGRLTGTIREGEHAGRTLSELRFDTLLELRRRWRLEDPDSARLLETWLDRTRGAEWREAAGDAGAETGGDERPASRGDAMDRHEALEVLGLEGTPDRDAIVRAHRRLMQQFHPDRGGSDWLAAQLNRAKERLLADLGEG